MQRAPLKILVVSAYHEPHVGGVEVIVSQQAHTLAALGHDVTVITSRYSKAVARHERIDGYTVIRLPAWNGLEDRYGVPLPLWSPNALWSLARLARNADVVHVHDAYHGSSILAASLARQRRRPLFITQHVGIVEHDKSIVSLAQKVIYSSVGRRLWRGSEMVTVYNPIVERFINEYGVEADKVKLVYNGIDTKTFKPGNPRATSITRRKYGLASEKPVILFVGRLVHKKGFQKLIDAHDPEYQIVLVGPGKIPGNVPSGTIFLGEVSRQELRHLYQASDIFAFPAVGEMLTLAMQEAMACGLPIVATADDNYSRYDLDPSGIALVSPAPEVLRSTFLNILGDPNRMKHMQTYSRSLAEARFDWEKNAKDIAAEYDSACSS
jgi:D-inositol-3-phosphate glycosyltransferase